NLHSWSSLFPYTTHFRYFVYFIFFYRYISQHKLVVVSPSFTQLIWIFYLVQQRLCRGIVLFVECLSRQKNCAFPKMAPHEVTNSSEDINDKIVMSRVNGIKKKSHRNGDDNHSGFCIHQFVKR